MRRLRVIAFFIFATLVPLSGQPDPTERVSHLPEANPYRAVALRWLSLPESDREVLSNWLSPDASKENASAPLDASHQVIARALANDLAAASKIGASQSELWPPKQDPKNPDNPFHLLIPDVGAMLDLARITTKVADTSPAADAIPLYAATARFGRDIRSGATLIQGLTGVAIEGIASAGTARRLTAFSPQELELLSSTWRQLPQPAGIEHALQSERNVFFIPLLERIILPGLLALQAEGIDTLDASSGSAVSPALKNLRLSGLIDADGEQLIHLENIATGHSFSVTNKRSAEGVKLIRFDAKSGRAWMRINGTPAVLDLQSKQFVSARDDIARLRKFLGEDLGNEPPSKTPEWVRRALAHPDGPEGYAIDLIEEYDRRMAEQVLSAQQSKKPQPVTPAPSTDPLLAMIMPTISQVARTLNAASLQPTLLEAAIRHRLGQSGATPPDPWGLKGSAETTAPFAFEKTPDGGFLLRSAYENRSGEPYTYKFGAPDAGVQRKPSSAQ
ncbi:hypothetical protein [Rariglobus hedericola]|uniref:Uncharacterized protein n=1 Tax=Rariglobus hedericola TaxID=2597822 RepID=A0A556QRT4_9BACT|nr:hypothetical protein [Rariglobus hedericola]TSJ79350.1 hypothetical protein FPL22_08690 [Rariglobus hedericola]